MITQKISFLQKFRIIATVFVVLVGLGGIFMSMKPATNAAHTYGVSLTSGGQHYEIKQDITNVPPDEYLCEQKNDVCTVSSDVDADLGTTIPIDQATVIRRGDFIPLN